MKTFFTLLAVLPCLALANSENHPPLPCMHDNKPLLVGDSVWVVDPQLVKRTADNLRERGFSEDAIDKEISRNDWVGFRLVCVKTFKANGSAASSQPGDILTETGVALVLNEYSKDFYQHIVESTATISPQ